MKPALDQPGGQVVEIGKPVYGGTFLARLEGKAVFVPLALPGEQTLIRITGSKASYSTAEVEEIVSAAAERVMPRCPHFGVCGGCHYQHAGYETQVRFKEAILRETLERGGVQVPGEIAVLAAETETHAWAYRNRIRLAFDAAGNPGYRGRRSHAIVPISECPIAAPLLMDAAMTSAEIARELGPALRVAEISLFCDPAETAVLASVFVSHGAKGSFEKFSQSLKERIPALAGAELAVESAQGKRGPTQVPRILARWGDLSLRYRAAGFEYCVDHGAFFQVNRWLVEPLVECVVDGHKGALAWDLFAGVGLFARRLTASFARVIAVEAAPAATKALAENLRGTASAPVRAATLDFLKRNAGTRPDLIVADPPRTGLGAETSALMAEIAAPSIAYVSCDPAALARDLRALVGAGYRIDSITLADLFPQTFHMETVVQLRRS